MSTTWLVIWLTLQRTPNNGCLAKLERRLFRNREEAETFQSVKDHTMVIPDVCDDLIAEYCRHAQLYEGVPVDVRLSNGR